MLPLVDGKVQQPGPDQKRTIQREDVAGNEDDVPDLAYSDSEVGEEEAEPSQYLPSSEQDVWSLNKYALTRHHPNGRMKLFTFDELDTKPPIPLKFIDVYRRTEVNEGDDTYEVNDAWYDEHKSGVDPQRELKEMWYGKTEFPLLKPAPPKGYKWCSGRLTKVQETTRPDYEWPEVWDS